MKTDRGFVVIAKDERQTPAVVCEECGETITDYGMAGVVWPERDYDEGSRQKATVLCKNNRCLSSGSNRYLPWAEFKHYVIWLLYNSGIRTEEQLHEAWRSAERMNRL